MDTFAVDAHALVWFITEDPRLSGPAKDILERAEDAQVQVLIPTIVLAEITYISLKKKVSITIDRVLQRIRQGDGFIVVPFDFSVFHITLQFPEDWDIHDRIIAATARYYKAKLITRDQTLQESAEVETVW